jgi:fatty acid desaturase
MLEQEQPGGSGRETMLTVVLTGLAAVACLSFLILVSGGILLNVVLVVAAIFGVGCMHYMLWGEAMDKDVRKEEQQEAEPAARSGEAKGVRANGKHDLSQDFRYFKR